MEDFRRKAFVNLEPGVLHAPPRPTRQRGSFALVFKAL